MRRIKLWVMAGLLAMASILAGGGCGCRRARSPVTGGEVQVPKPLPARTVPVYCYHSIVPTARGDYETSVADFTTQMEALHQAGYKTVTGAQLADYLAGERDLPPRSVMLTFDDGKADFLTGAAPVLERFGYQAVLFVITDSVGGKGQLSWGELQQLSEQGHEIGSHTASHLNLTRLEKGQSLSQLHERVGREIETSVHQLEEKLGQPPVALAYPYGNYDEYAQRRAREAGFRLAFSIDPGVVDQQSHPYRLPRKMVVKGSSLATLQRLVETRALHLSEVQPPVGERVTGTSYHLTARVTDPDAIGHLQVETGRQAEVKLDEATSQLTVTATLNRGANLVRLFSTGTPRRECGWVVVCDP